ncbi:MAG: membrane dipeptidase [Planctomycetota bacterium]
MRRWFDAHLDLAYLAVCGRDMTRTLETLHRPKNRVMAGPHPPASVTLASMREGGVCDALGTIFTEAGGNGPYAYASCDTDGAREAGLRQLRCYHNWVHDAGVRLTRFEHSTHAEPDEQDGPNAYASTTKTHSESTVRIGILIENADPIAGPDELAWWVERGVVAIGLSWAVMSRYAGGNTTGEGLTDLGRDMIDAMDGLGVAHDLSHLSQRAADELLARAKGPVMASHSNCRALLDGANERHLDDATVREIVARGGVIGLNLCAPFVRHGVTQGQRPPIDDALRHVEHICDIAGDRAHVGLGSDLDGGFSANNLPEGIDRPADYERLAQGLAQRGWSDQELDAFASANWLGFFARAASQPA